MGGAWSNKLTVEAWDNSDCTGPVNYTDSTTTNDWCLSNGRDSVYLTCDNENNFYMLWSPYAYMCVYTGQGVYTETGKCVTPTGDGIKDYGSLKVTCEEDPCFGAADTYVCHVKDSSLSAADAYDACFSTSDDIGAERVLMSSLTAGDIVLSEADGAPAKTSVVVNQHAAEDKSSALLNIRHELGSLSLTADHVLHLNGRFVPAREAKPGDLLSDVTLGAVEVESVAASRGTIINPITADGKVLAAGGSGAPVLAATANEWLADVLLSAYPKYTLSFALAAAFPRTVQAFYDALLEPFFSAAVPILTAGKAVAPTPVVAASFVVGDILLAGGLVLFALCSLKMILAIAVVAVVRRAKA